MHDTASFAGLRIGATVNASPGMATAPAGLATAGGWVPSPLSLPLLLWGR